MKRLINFLMLLSVCSLSTAQVAINNSNDAAHASSMLDVTSNSRGVLIPRLTMAERNAIPSPATGLIIYQTDNTPGLYTYTGSSWTAVADNLGSHAATTSINISNFRIYNNDALTGIRLDQFGGLTLRAQRSAVGPPSDILAINRDAGFVVRGEIGYGAIPASGPGYRMMWHPNKVAFRAGQVDGDQWDNDNVDYYTAAFGLSTIASGIYSFAAGNACMATGNASVAMGNLNQATGEISTTFGSANRARGNLSSAFGISNRTLGYASTVVGMYNDSVLTGTPQSSATSATPLFIVGNGVDHNNRSNAVVVLKNGNVGIGTNTPSQKLHVVGIMCTTGGVVSCSDVRYKTNILPVTNVLSSLTALHGIYYNWKKDFKGFNEARQIGFSAQEVENVFPEMVQTDAEGYKAVDYSRMAPVLVEAIKEQQTLIESQKQEIDLMKKDMELLKKQMAELLSKSK